MSALRFAQVLVLMGCMLTAGANHARAQEDLSKDFDRITSKVQQSRPDVFQVNKAALEFAKKHNSKGAVKFLRLKAAEAGNKSIAQLAAFLGLAHLSGVDKTEEILVSFLDDKNGYRSQAASAGLSFLPANKARALAENMMPKSVHRDKFMLLLRAVGNEQTIQKLKKMPTPKERQGKWAVRDRTVDSLATRFRLKQKALQESWARQELMLLQVSQWLPNFRAISMDYHWAAARLHAHGERFSDEFLLSKLNFGQDDRWDWDDLDESVPICAAIAGKQKTKALLPILRKLASEKLGYVSSICRDSIRVITDEQKAQQDAPQRTRTSSTAELQGRPDLPAPREARRSCNLGAPTPKRHGRAPIIWDRRFEIGSDS